MSVGPMGGVAGSAAGAPLSQTKGSESERTQKDASAHQRQVDSQEKTEKSVGIGQTEQDQGASERDADGRRFWEASQGKEPESATPESEPSRQSIDPVGESGSTLDLTG